MEQVFLTQNIWCPRFEPQFELVQHPPAVRLTHNVLEQAV